MEIHPPRRIASLKEFFKELLTITVGILIALSLEGLLEWRHHRGLVREARANIMSELRENQRELKTEEQDLEKMQQQTRKLVNLVHRLESNRKAPPEQVQLTWTFAELHTTSWDTAIRTGAVSYMPYPEVKRYTQTYDLQRAFTDFQQRAVTISLEVEGLGTLTERKPETLSAAELADAERRIGIAAAGIAAMQQIAKPLDQRYEQTLNPASGER